MNGHVKDLTGKRFGRLIVQHEIKERKNKRVYWHCVCDCGKKVDIQSSSLIMGHTQSCGCYNREKTSERSLKDLIGQRFGKLIVIYRASDTEYGHVAWHCVCDCGREVDVSSNHLSTGHTRSCGCYEKEKRIEKQSKILIGKRFGKLVIIKYSYSEKKSTGNFYAYWECLCDCGNIINVKLPYLLNGDTKSCGCLSESSIASEIKKYFVENYNAKTEYNILKNTNTKHYLPYDIYIPQGNNPIINGIYVEVNGIQHYKLQNWHKMKAKRNNTTPEQEFQYQKDRDILKKKFAKKNGTYIKIDLRKIKTIKEAIGYIKNKNQLTKIN